MGDSARMNVYEVYDVQEKKVVFTGLSREIQKKFNTHISINNYAKGEKAYFGKYIFNIIGNAKNEEIRKVNKKTDRNFEYLLERLTKESNTTYRGDPELYREKLKEKGIEFISKPSKFDRKSYILERTN